MNAESRSTGKGREGLVRHAQGWNNIFRQCCSQVQVILVTLGLLTSQYGVSLRLNSYMIRMVQILPADYQHGFP